MKSRWHTTRSLGVTGERTISGGGEVPASGGRSRRRRPCLRPRRPTSVNTGSAPSAPAGTPSTGTGTPSAPSMVNQLPAVQPNADAPTSTIDTGPAVEQVTDAVRQTGEGVARCSRRHRPGHRQRRRRIRRFAASQERSQTPFLHGSARRWPGDFVTSLMDTSLYSIGAFFHDTNAVLADDVVDQAEAIERAGLEDTPAPRGSRWRPPSRRS